MKSYNKLEKDILRDLISNDMFRNQSALRTSVFLENYAGPERDLSLLLFPGENGVGLSYPKSRDDRTKPIVFFSTLFLLLQL